MARVEFYWAFIKKRYGSYIHYYLTPHVFATATNTNNYYILSLQERIQNSYMDQKAAGFQTCQKLYLAMSFF